jgi:hypothetical protein
MVRTLLPVPLRPAEIGSPPILHEMPVKSVGAVRTIEVPPNKADLAILIVSPETVPPPVTVTFISSLIGNVIVMVKLPVGVAVTVTVAVPDLVLSTVDVALIVKVVCASSAATVKTPPVVILVPVAFGVSTDHVTPCPGLPVPVTDAVNVCVPLMATLTVAGVTVTVETVIIVTVAVPDLLGSTVEVAVTVKEVEVSSAAMVRTPPGLVILVPVPPPVTAHVTVCAGLLSPTTVAVNVCVAPLFKLTVAGLTVTLETVGVGAVTVTKQVAVLFPSAVVTVIVAVPAAIAVT